jgi:ATP-dependent Clp protease protease subunit
MTRNAARNSGEVTIYGDIGSSWWGDSITPKQFAADLKDLGDVDEITVRINSAGGAVFDGLAIRSLLKNHKATVTTHVDGLAASIASIIAMAGDKIVMAKGAMMMIHNPATSLWGGESKDFREVADFLDKVRDSLVEVYSARTGLSAEKLIEMMDAETWMSADEAVEMGFADEVEDGVVTASMSGAVASVNGVKMDFSKFINAPKLPAERAKSDKGPTPFQVATVPVAHLSPMDKGAKKIMDLEQLKNEYPNLYAEAVKAGVEQERARIKALDDLADASNQEIINKAKFETGASAAEAALEIVAANKQKLANMGKKLKNDADTSGIDKVDPEEPEDKKEAEAAEAEAAAGKIAGLINRRRGVAK